ncbi:FAD-binding oxidoreductase [Aquihabitans sp. G128]|uniref:FAD-binding oxidoreductase n=1 Tax=Aquihabitans sp. G128 TaxID=2849779 RepID=UPI001C234E2A|nr:FAD-binding oxidoreductase [Aquihabitans sp. G128]QXC62340.1 FAD-binding oxidoreductase [Aquihabitans sp. G128]
MTAVTSTPGSPPPGAPTPPIAIAGDPAGATGHLTAPIVLLGDDFLADLADACADVRLDPGARAEASRDWWPLAMVWATDGEVGQVAGAVARPTSVDEVANVLRLCNEARVPVTPAGGRSSVVGGTIPVHGGVVLDLTELSGIGEVDGPSGLVEVWAGTFGDAFETELQATHGLTVGHWPQSMSLSTVGGWLACRGAGQLSNRYGKIEDIVIGLEVVLADGRVVRTGGQPRQAVGPDLTQLFVGAEGTLGVITRAWLQAFPAPTHTARSAYGFSSFSAALDAMRQVIQRGAQTAVLRLYDGIESQRNFGVDPSVNVLLAYDEGDPLIVDAGMAVVADACAAADRLDDSLVETWFGHRNNVDALEALISKGFVVDTMEISAPWSTLDAIYDAATTAISAVPGTMAVSAHQSHSYVTGACLYFTFAARVEPAERDGYYAAAWDAGTRAVLANGGSLSHHHGIGLNRARFVADALGDGLGVLAQLKAALDPNGICNPGKLGLPDPFGAVRWPAP